MRSSYIVKQTHLCAWIVFRFILNIAVHRLHECREAEARYMAAMAKIKRKERLRKTLDGSKGRPVTDSFALDDEKEDIDRSAQVASDVAKIAAASQELQEPALQVLWFTIEFHRKAFDIL